MFVFSLCFFIFDEEGTLRWALPKNIKKGTKFCNEAFFRVD